MTDQKWAKQIEWMGRRWRLESSAPEDVSYIRKSRRISLVTYDGEFWSASLDVVGLEKHSERAGAATFGHPTPARALAALQRLVWSIGKRGAA